MVEVFEPSFDLYCGSAPDVLGREGYGRSFTVTLARCLICEEHQWSVRLAPQVPWINAVQRAIFRLRAEMLEQLC
jgi:hypothetical protein